MIKVLDHGYVKLIDKMGDDRSIINAARMSTGRGFISWSPYMRCRNCEEVGSNSVSHRLDCLVEDLESFPRGDLGLLDTLWRSKHSTPFEFCEIAFEVQAPIFVFREWMRHRTQSFAEFSARYSKMPNLHYVPTPDRVQAQSTDNRQGSGDTIDDQEIVDNFLGYMANEQKTIYAAYEAAIKDDIAKEVARINTPVSRYSRMQAKTDLRNWLGFLNLRLRPAAQWEIRQYAQAIAIVIAELFPRTWALFEEYDLYGVSLSRTEMELLRGEKETDILSKRRRDEFTNKLTNGGKAIL